MALALTRSFIVFISVLLILLSVLTINSRGEPVACSDLLILFARGSGQNSDITDGSFPNSGLKTKEYQSKTFFEEIDKRVQGLTAEYISLHDFSGKYNKYGYQAVDAVDGFKHKPNHRSDVSNRYYESVKDGAEELTWFLEDRMTSCPFQQIILGGYSQGAHVVGDALYKIKQNLKPRIAYVALYGDPKFNPRTSNIPIKTGPWVRGNAFSVQSGILLPRSNYLPDEIANAKSWCDLSDPICANYSLGQFIGSNLLLDMFADKTHSNIYQNKWIPQSANEIVITIKQNNPVLSNRIQTIPFVNKNDKLYQLDLALVIDTTGSMNSMISTIQSKLDGFITALFNSYWDTRVGIVAFNDFQHKTIPFYYSKEITDFTYDKTKVKADIKSLSAFYGGDEPEALYSGLMTAMNDLNWRQGAQKKILVITDAPAKNPDPGPEHWTKTQVLKRALELDPVSVSIVALPVNYPWPYTNTTLNKQVDEAFNSTVLDLAAQSNGMITNGQRDYRAEYATSTLDLMAYQPVASISGPSQGYVGEILNFSAGDSYDPDNSIKEYSWDCNNDGIWDISSQNIAAECQHAQAYDGLVVLEIHSNDGGSAKAIYQISVSSRTNDKTPLPETPNVTATRQNGSLNLIWQNDYPQNTTIKITDDNGDILGYASGINEFLLEDVSDDAFDINISAGNNTGWSKPVHINIGPVLLSKILPGLVVNVNSPVTTSLPANIFTNSQFNSEPYPASQTQQNTTRVLGASSSVLSGETKQPGVKKNNTILIFLSVLILIALTASGYFLIANRKKH